MTVNGKTGHSNRHLAYLKCLIERHGAAFLVHLCYSRVISF